MPKFSALPSIYRVAGTVLTALGGIAYVYVCTRAATAPLAEHLRATIATGSAIMTVAGVVVLVGGAILGHLSGMTMVYIHGRPSVQRAHRPAPRRRRKRKPSGGTAPKAEANGHGEIDPRYLADMSEAVRIGRELERREREKPDEE